MTTTPTTPAEYCNGCGFPAADCECNWHTAYAKAQRLARPMTLSENLFGRDDVPVDAFPAPTAPMVEIVDAFLAAFYDRNPDCTPDAALFAAETQAERYAR